MKKQVFTIVASIVCGACMAQTNFNQYNTGGSSLLNNYGNVTGGGAIINGLNRMENTKGTRFMFNTWLTGTVTDAQGNVINSDSLGYNFDKQADNLIIKKDNQSVISIVPSQVKDFTLVQENKSYHFARVNKIDSSKLLLSLVESANKYSLYKDVKTVFVQANYQTNGIAESGHEYDEYVDKSTYYILQPSGTYKNVDLKLKSIKSAFSDDKSKLFDFMGQHIDDTIDENYLVSLVTYMNQ